jgi:drug/metabolite transporter (DMT)-like permease
MEVVCFMQVIALLALFMLCKGVNTVTLKRAQSGRGGFFQHMLFTFVFCIAQGLVLFLLPPYRALSFAPERLLLPFLFGSFYVVFMIFTVMALREGPTSLTTIIGSFNPLFPIIAGLLLWGDAMRWWQIAGLLLFCAALFLFNSGSYTEADAKKPITLKWIVLALLGLTFSGLAVICTRRYCDLYPGYIKEYLLVFCATGTLWTLPFVIWGWIGHRAELTLDRNMIVYSFATALAVDISNIIFMLYASAFDAAFYFPLMSVLGVASVMLAGRFILKERVSRRAIAGIVVSAAALALLAVK